MCLLCDNDQLLLNYLLSGVLLYFQGNVYVKCMTPQVAAAAFNSLNGRFFAGKYRYLYGDV